MRLSSFNADGNQIRDDLGNHLRAFFLLLRKLIFVVRGIRRLGGVVRFGFEFVNGNEASAASQVTVCVVEILVPSALLLLSWS